MACQIGVSIWLIKESQKDSEQVFYELPESPSKEVNLLQENVIPSPCILTRNKKTKT